MRIILKKGVIFILLVILSFLCSYFLWQVSLDEIWNYGFAFNISQGLIPYRDFNMVILPLYPIIVSFFIKFFGHQLYAMHIFHAILMTIMIFCMWHKLHKKVILIIPIILIYSFPGYNLFTLFLMIILINICDYEFKYFDLVLGILISMIFLTKQTVGICLTIPFLYYSKDKIKGLIGFLTPISIFLSYLVYNNALYECFNYCFLGMFDFVSNNKILLFLPIELLVIIILFYKLVKSKYKDKILFYTIMYQIIMFPIFDFYHFLLCFILLLYVFLLRVNIFDYKLKYLFIIILFVSIYFCIMMNDCYKEYHLYSDNSSYLYGRYLSYYGEKNIEKISNYIDLKRKEYDNFYILSCISYQIKLELNLTLNKFDLINNSNMGYNGFIEYINEIRNTCDESSCLFLLYKFEFYDNDKSQTNNEIVEYVMSNYKKIDEYTNFDVYSNLDGEK